MNPRQQEPGEGRSSPESMAVALFYSVAITAGYQSLTRVPEFDWVRQSAAFLNFIQPPRSRNQHSARVTSLPRMQLLREYLPPFIAGIPQASLRSSFRSSE
jgi:hypothetical protein